MITQDKLQIDLVEFYITNVCNLTCKGCNRFNDTKFRGWQNWHDYRDVYTQWSQQLIWNTASIMGGEPLLNPSLYDWIDGINGLWKKTVDIASNGTQIHLHPKLYDYIRDGKARVNIAIHNKKHKKVIIDRVKSIMRGPFRFTFDNEPFRERLTITDSRLVSIRIQYEWWFHQGAVIYRPDGSRTLHQSDVQKAHRNCHSKYCHHFDKGVLYKCGPSALFPEYDKQHGLDLSPQDRTLMLEVPRLTIDDSIETKKRFLESIRDPIPQCKFCPETYIGQQIFSESKASTKDLL